MEKNLKKEIYIHIYKIESLCYTLETMYISYT